MNGFSQRTPLDGWKCNYCGSDTHTPETHAEKCLPTQKATVNQLRAELAAAQAENERLRAALTETRDILKLAMSDIFQTARTNQCNINGVDMTCPDDEPCVSRIGRHFVHQAGIYESMEVYAAARKILAKYNGLCARKDGEV